MIAKVIEHTLTDGSKVFDVELEESGVTLASIACTDEDAAHRVLDALDSFSLVKVVR